LSGHEGTILHAIQYGPFGEKISTAGAANNNQLHFTGREEDSDNGLYYFRARYYDPAIGRFVTEDPKGFAAGVNFYAYCNNNGINANDPSGKISGIGDFIAWAGIKTAEYAVKGISYLAGNPMTDKQFKAMDESLMGVWKAVATTAAPYVAGGSVAAATGSVTNGAYAEFGTKFAIDVLAGEVPDPIPPVKLPLGTSYLFEAGKDILFNPSVVNDPKLDNISRLNQNSLSSFSMPESYSSSAAGGFVIYPNKPNTNMMKSVYSK
jgi:RHS repeat-associated protein